MGWTNSKTAITVAILVTVSDVSHRLGAFLLTLPIISLIALLMSWQQHRNLPAISRLARETLVLVPLGLPFFLPLAFAERFRLEFWPAFLIGLALATATIGLWLCRAIGWQEPFADPRLARLVGVWGLLPDVVRDEMLRLADAACRLQIHGVR